MSKNTSLKTEKLGKYYVEMKNNIDRPRQTVHRLDKNGVLLYKIPYTEKYDYYPVSIALYALGNFEMYLDTKKSSYKEIFLKQADWLVNNIKIKTKGFGVWEHNFTLPYYEFKTPWVHGMAQGLAISVLLRAYQFTNDKKYLENAEKAYKAFEADIENGGVKFVDDKGDTWLEEYAISPPPHVLNGFIFSLFGIYDLYLVTKNKNTMELWNQNIKTLEKNIEKYDTGYWSLYSLPDKHPADKSYHTLHIEQLKILFKLTNNEIFNEYAKKWENYLNKPTNRMEALLKKNISSIKKHGIIGSTKRYMSMRKWKKG